MPLISPCWRYYDAVAGGAGGVWSPSGSPGAGIVTAPCPDCGAEYPLAEFVHGGVRLSCLRCGYFGPVCPSIQEAGIAWDKAVREARE